MCGITGIYSKDAVDRLEKRIDIMNESIAHRGPDSGAFYTFEQKLALGHRRLSIIDLREIANQPMHSSSGVWHIVFNGEIYNFQEIANELNYTFTSDSDTEVILAAVQEKSLNWFLEIANGMFSIALFNSETKELFLVRDRLGIKPLYYYKDNQNLVFSSEIKGILSSGLVEAKFNELAVDEYLANRYIRSPYTFFENIYQIQPGTYLTVKGDLSVTETIYWNLPTAFNTATEFNEDSIAEKFEEELVKAIKYRLIADVPLGTYLSGGVDSSLITAITALEKVDAVNTYTIGFEELNEFSYAQQIADKYHTVHHELLMQKSDYMNQWERLIGFKDAPLGVPNEIPLAVMSSKLKEKITVVLSGEGADELMGGYGRIFRAPFDYENEEIDQSFYSYLMNKYEYVPREMRDQLITTPTKYREEFDKQIQLEFENTANEENVFRFFHNYHVKGLLQRVDMTTMQTSVEARVPFLDHKLIEYAYNEIPYVLKLKWINEESKAAAKQQCADEYSEELDTPKYLLRKIAYKYLPDETITRKKVGFPVPLTQWFENLEEMARKLLTKSSWLKPGVIEELISKSKTETRAGQILWMFLNIELFKRQYFSKEWRW
ncbi:asparagine synthase (glutamine-hydrolyzing) [Aurantibacter crassamenti]|uniref:asparagine synthase (glutamine-hydrolyzing) n=1 Tax=Aurantibacter crassamenti TaxID=1837375 RepID=UPI001939BF2E|nr:asparagine synthase (glutamine-hydrolyzing) [Aurantibacter crassamenti]MBM1105251.1 asparagine synthase (glutamine-hydrolyzing) [Aurantibacter crassamenti]